MSSTPRWWLPAALAAALSLPFLTQPGHVSAQQAGAAHLFAITAPGANQGQNVLFVLDPESTRLLVYEHRAGGAKGALKLVAVRNLQHEREFEEWPGPKAKVQVPSVGSLREELEKLRAKE